jgi:hypothetical protein
MARRYHWLSARVESYVDEPHAAICCDERGDVLNLVAHDNDPLRRGSVALAGQPPEQALRTIVDAVMNAPRHHPPPRELFMPSRHELLPEFDVAPAYLEKILVRTYDRAPEDYEALLGIEGVGPKTLRALALASELVHGTPASVRDPARFAFAHGGKDGIPFPVDRITYEKTIEVLEKAINRSTVDRSDKVKAFRRLANWAATPPSPASSSLPSPSESRR